MGDATIFAVQDTTARHPDDPDVIICTKATAAFGLGLLAAATGIVLGGLIPAAIALVLARQAQQDISTSQGWFAGMRHVTWARRLAWAGIALAVLGAVLVTAVRLLQGAGSIAQNFPHTVD